MPFSLNHNCFFCHIPRTAGSSINIALGIYPWEKFIFNNQTQHMTIPQLINRKIIGPEGKLDLKTLENMFKFTIVRNPWDRLVSGYVCLKKKNILRQNLNELNGSVHLTNSSN